MIIVFDIGNTNVCAAVFGGDALLAVVRKRRRGAPGRAWWREMIDRACADAGIGAAELAGAAVCSVVPAANRSLCSEIVRVIGRQPLVITGGLPLGLGISYADPDRLGPDRVCAMLAAKKNYGPPVIVVDCGTAVTFDGIDRRGRHAGGMIAPGLAASAASLAGSTALLPRVRRGVPARAAAHSTRDAIAAGTFYSVVGSVRENVRQLKKLVGGEPVVVGTGGDAPTVARAARLFDVIDPTLVLEGALLAYRKVSRRTRGGKATASRRGAKR
jgi:type III pantothenate kinase